MIPSLEDKVIQFATEIWDDVHSLIEFDKLSVYKQGLLRRVVGGGGYGWIRLSYQRDGTPIAHYMRPYADGEDYPYVSLLITRAMLSEGGRMQVVAQLVAIAEQRIQVYDPQFNF